MTRVIKNQLPIFFMVLHCGYEYNAARLYSKDSAHFECLPASLDANLLHLLETQIPHRIHLSKFNEIQSIRKSTLS